MDEKKLITEEQLLVLPIREIVTSGVKLQVRCDEANKRMYLLDENGKYTGKSAFWDPSTINRNNESANIDASPMEISPDQRSGNAVDITECEQANDETKQAEPADQKKSSVSPVMVVFLIALFIIVITIISFLFKGLSISDHNSTTDPTDAIPATQSGLSSSSKETQPSEEATTPPAITESTAPSGTEEDNVILLSPTTDILPGELLKDLTITSVSVPKSDYLLLSTITGLYTADDLASLRNMIATDYIPAGSYLNHENVGASYTAVNPWAILSTEQASVTLPVTVPDGELLNYLWGNQVNIKITLETKYSGSSEIEIEQDATLPNGIQSDSTEMETTVVTTYVVQRALICDVYDANGNSLFPRYHTLSQLPATIQANHLENQYQNSSSQDADLPHSISVMLDMEQFNLVAALDTESITVEIEAIAPYCETSLQSEEYEELQAVGNAIQAAQQEIN